MILLGLVLAMLAILRFGLLRVTVDGESMAPTFRSGDRILATRMWPRFALRRDQVVILRTSRLPLEETKRALKEAMLESAKEAAATYAKTTGNPVDDNTIRFEPVPWNELTIKRLVGLPGDRVKIPLSSLPEDHQEALQSVADENGDLTWDVPYDKCFIRGDSFQSTDSLTFGPVPIDAVVGVMLLRLQTDQVDKVLLDPPPVLRHPRAEH